MKIILNGEDAQTSAKNLEELCQSLGHKADTVATAVNGTFVPIASRSTAPLKENAKIEIVSPRQGG